MRAIRSRRPGSADNLYVAEVLEPEPVPGEIVVAVHATTVTRGDVVLRRMPRLLSRLVGEVPKVIPGHEFAGEITEVGSGVTTFVPGDRVFGTTTGLARGAHAEYVSVPEGGMVATIPAGIDYREAAPVPIGAMAALHFLGKGGVAAGRHVLVNGASGSVGTFAVQIARHRGARVTAVCGPSNVELMGSLGADEVIDYTQRDFTQSDGRYDLVFDAVGKTSAKRVAPVLAPGGAFVTTNARRDEKRDELAEVRDLLEAGAVVAVIDRTYSLDQIAEAHRHVETGHKRGNVVVLVSAPDPGQTDPPSSTS